MSLAPVHARPRRPDDGLERPPLVTERCTPGWLTDTIAGLAEGRTPFWWWVAFVPSLGGTVLLGWLLLKVTVTGLGLWGINHPVMWGFAIVNFVWWIGIGHAGTLISAILYLLRQRWRTSINRAAEAMTLFAVVCAAIYPTIHVGRAWLVWWLAPVPTANALWPQFRSPLMWDLFAIGTYFTVSALFWYVGLVPDLAALRDRARTRLGKVLYGFFALGWTGSNRHWHHYEKTYLLLAGLATPLVLSVHSIVSLDFAVANVPGWHATIFPPYFVAGAIFSGMAMVLTLVLPLRALCRLGDIITARHLDLMAKVTLATGLMVAYAYGMEWFTAWYGGHRLEQELLLDRATGHYAWAFWIMVLGNVLFPQLFWFRAVRRSAAAVFVVALLINAGMWCERFVIVVTALHRDFLPANWGVYQPTWVDLGTFAGTFGLFFTCFLLFIRFVPVIAMAEVKGATPYADPQHPLGGGPAGTAGASGVAPEIKPGGAA